MRAPERGRAKQLSSEEGSLDRLPQEAGGCSGETCHYISRAKRPKRSEKPTSTTKGTVSKENPQEGEGTTRSCHLDCSPQRGPMKMVDEGITLVGQGYDNNLPSSWAPSEAQRKSQSPSTTGGTKGKRGRPQDKVPTPPRPRPPPSRLGRPLPGSSLRMHPASLTADAVAEAERAVTDATCRHRRSEGPQMEIRSWALLRRDVTRIEAKTNLQPSFRSPGKLASPFLQAPQKPKVAAGARARTHKWLGKARPPNGGKSIRRWKGRRLQTLTNVEFCCCNFKYLKLGKYTTTRL